MPLDFIYEQDTNSYRLDLYEDDQALVEKINTGKGDPRLFTSANYLYIDGIFAATEPKTVEQRERDSPSKPIGENNLKKAKVA